MREWLVGGALVENARGLLLVRNQRRGGSHDWSPPGGVIDDGESLLEGLTREVLEETGLAVTEWAGPTYEVEAQAPDMGWTLRVEVHRAVSYAGSLVVADPDGIVDAVRFADGVECEECLAAGPRWVREPLGEWLSERWSETRAYRYRVEGTDRASLVVSRR